MSAPARFETDVFLGYADLDDASVLPGEAGWVTGFRTALGAFAQQIIGRPLTFADAANPGVGPIGSATFVAILSPGYLTAVDRLADLGTFAHTAAIAAGATGGAERRLFKVVKIPVQQGETPEPLKACLEYAFFDVDDATGTPREFRAELGPEAKQRFLSKTYELAQDVCARVTQLQENGPGTVPSASVNPPAAGPAGRDPTTPTQAVRDELSPPETPSSETMVAVGRANGGVGRTVYLAQTTSDQTAARDLVRGELLQLGHVVLPDRDLPLSADELKHTVEKALDGSDVAIHLIGNTYGLVPEGESRSILELQCEMSAARGLPRLIWVASDGRPADDRQAAFIETLESQADTRRSTDLLRTPLEVLKTEIRDTLAGVAEAERDPSAGDVITVYVMCDQDDYRATKPLADFLTDTGYQVWRPTFSGEPPDILKLHKKRLRECDANIVYYGKATDTWFELKLEDWEKASGLRTGQMLAQAVYVGAPLTDHKRSLRITDAIVIESPDEFSPRVLEPLIRQIRHEKSTG